MERIDLEGGKYTVTNDNGKLEALRYGQPWRSADLVGDNLVYAMFVEIDRLRQAGREMLAAFGNCGSPRQQQAADTLRDAIGAAQ